jgi:hypothetical protein
MTFIKSMFLSIDMSEKHPIWNAERQDGEKLFKKELN